MARKHLGKDEAAVARDELRDLAGWLAGIMHEHGGRSAMVRCMVVDGQVTVAANLYTQAERMGAPTPALEFREVLG
mgnify:CR=1 FL=1